jgi:hypothetical protein
MGLDQICAGSLYYILSQLFSYLKGWDTDDADFCKAEAKFAIHFLISA